MSQCIYICARYLAEFTLGSCYMKKCIFATFGHLSQICDFTLPDSPQGRSQSVSANGAVGAEAAGMEPARGNSDAMRGRGLSPGKACSTARSRGGGQVAPLSSWQGQRQGSRQGSRQGDGSRHARLSGHVRFRAQGWTGLFAGTMPDHRCRRIAASDSLCKARCEEQFTSLPAAEAPLPQGESLKARFA